MKSLAILFGLIVLVNANMEQFKKQCQTLRCNSTTEICRINPKCNTSNEDPLMKCVYCALKNTRLSPTTSQPERNMKLLGESSYDEYYDYGDEEDDATADRVGFNGDDDYSEEYATDLDQSQRVYKAGICPKVVEATGECNPEKSRRDDCQVDKDCPGELKCCQAACGQRVCNIPIQSSISHCPKSFDCSRNCPLGYRTDANGCLICECQSCPSMKQCTRTCQTGYLKDLFGCDLCECNELCPPFSCQLSCPPGVGFDQLENGCPLCRCALSKPQSTERTSSCQKDIHCPAGFRCLNDARNVPMCQAGRCPQAFY